jgi:sortase (surface protein transpeptidase)
MIVDQTPHPDVVEALSLIRTALQELQLTLTTCAPIGQDNEYLLRAGRRIDELDTLVEKLELDQRHPG